MNRIYLDNAATTPVRDEVLRKMLPWFTERYGNPSGVYETGREARKAVEEARRKVAAALSCDAHEVYFTSGGTESDNWAIKGAALGNMGKGRHIVSSAIEHHAGLHALESMEKHGFEISYVKPDEQGIISPDAVRKAVREDTILISIMAANNEIGTLQPVREIGRLAREGKILFHTDAVQAIGAVPVDVKAWQADLLSLSAHKFHGPKGVGALYIKRGAITEAFMHGGAQERGRRAGTENLPAIVGLGEAIEIAAANQPVNSVKVSGLRDRLIHGILSAIPDARLNGHPTNRLPNNVNVSFEGVDAEALLLRLDLVGIAASSGAACAAGSRVTSHVLRAIGLHRGYAEGSLRLTLSELTTEAEVDEVLRVLPEIVLSLRNDSHAHG